MGTRFALVGDIHGRFEVLADALDVARGRWGQFDFVLAVAGQPSPAPFLPCYQPLGAHRPGHGLF